MGWQYDAPYSASQSMRRTQFYRLPFLRLPPLMMAPASLTNPLSVPDLSSSPTRSVVETSIRTPCTSKIGNDDDPVRRWSTGSSVSTSTRSLTSIIIDVGRRLKESTRVRSSRVTAEGFPRIKRCHVNNSLRWRTERKSGYLCVHHDRVIFPSRRNQTF